MPHETLPADIAVAIENLLTTQHCLTAAVNWDQGVIKAQAGRDKACATLRDAILRHLNGKTEDERALSAIAEGAA